MSDEEDALFLFMFLMNYARRERFKFLALVCFPGLHFTKFGQFMGHAHLFEMFS